MTISNSRDGSDPSKVEATDSAPPRPRSALEPPMPTWPHPSPGHRDPWQQPSAPQGWGRFWAGFAVGAAATIVLGGVLVFIALILGLPGGSSAPQNTRSGTSPALGSSYTLQGSLTLAATSSSGSGNYTSNAGSCQGANGYNDVSAGAGVNVYDAQGAVVALGHLDPGSATAGGCTFSFSVANVPDNGGIVQVEVSHRGRVSVSSEEAKSGSASFTLGSN